MFIFLSLCSSIVCLTYSSSYCFILSKSGLVKEDAKAEAKEAPKEEAQEEQKEEAKEGSLGP